MSEIELPRIVKVKALTEDSYVVEADTAERSALAKRFGVSEIQVLTATLVLTPEKSDIRADGTLTAEWTQPCAVAGEDFANTAEEPLHFRFVPPYAEVSADQAEEVLEIDTNDCDEIPYEGGSFDLGEAVAQSFGLLIDPYAAGPNADRARKEKGIQVEGEQDGPLAEMLAGLKQS